MENRILGLHHITAIAGQAQRNFEFYTRVLCLRLVKKTVNFDDPGTYHFYYGDELGNPGGILTFFPWEGIQPGHPGPGMATETGYSVPEGSLEFWLERFTRFNVPHSQISERLGEQILEFKDPDGLELSLVIPVATDPRKPWETTEVKSNAGIKGFHSVTLTLNRLKPTADILTEVFGYTFDKQEGNRSRFSTTSVPAANIIDIIETPGERPGLVAGGSTHHIAFRVPNENVLMEFREKIESRGLNITPKIDRNYFYSLYFREPGGVLFEIATDNPGFAIDEPVSELGKNLKLPAQYEKNRQQIEQVLPVIN